MPRQSHHITKWRVKVTSRELYAVIPEESWTAFDQELTVLVHKFATNVSVVREASAEGSSGMVGDPYQERGSFTLRAHRRELRATAVEED